MRDQESTYRHDGMLLSRGGWLLSSLKQQHQRLAETVSHPEFGFRPGDVSDDSTARSNELR
jgi:hypothetical protein